MKRANLHCWTLLATLIPAGLAISGCQSASHPDDRQAVYNALTQHDLASVVVHQDRRAGIITLTGIVGSPGSKTAAENYALQAAPGYTVSNQLTVDNTGIMSMAQPDTTNPGATAKNKPSATPQR